MKATPIATMLMTTPGWKTAVTSTADRIAGNPCTASTNRINPSSSQPPR